MVGDLFGGRRGVPRAEPGAGLLDKDAVIYHTPRRCRALCAGQVVSPRGRLSKRFCRTPAYSASLSYLLLTPPLPPLALVTFVSSALPQILHCFWEQVAAAIERGEEPPDIKVVEDRLSASAPGLSLSSTPSPPKPWEAVSGAGVAGMEAPAPDNAAVERGGGGVRGYLGGEDGKSLPLSASPPPHSPQHHAVSVGP